MEFCETCSGTGYVCVACLQAEDACNCEDGDSDIDACDDCGGSGEVDE